MLKPAVVVVALACAAAFGAVGLAAAAGHDPAPNQRAVVVEDSDGDVLASAPLHGNTFAVSYRNSIYQTMAEERYEILPDGRYRLEQIAAEQLAVLEEYYGVPGTPFETDKADRRNWAVPPDPAHPAVFEELSIAATDLGERTLHVPGEEPLPLWPLVEDENPYIVLDIKELQ
ncbi:hypothetical protein [Arthrobacter monumenti]